MSILVTSQIAFGNLGAMTDYLERAKKDQKLPRIEAAICDIGGTPVGYNRAARRLLDKTMRKSDGQSIVISYTEKEFPSAGNHAKEVAEHAYEVGRRGAPDAPLLVIVQRDGKGGRWHAHIIVLNHNMVTGKANRGNWNHTQWRETNDAYNKEVGLEVCKDTAEMSKTARLAAQRGRELQVDADLIITPPSEVMKNDVDQFLGAHVMKATEKGLLDVLPEPGEELLVPLAGHPDHSLSVRAKSTGLSYAVTDTTGQPVMCATGARGGKPRLIASPGKKLDKALGHGSSDITFTRPGMTELVALLHGVREEELDDEHVDEREIAEGREGQRGREAGEGEGVEPERDELDVDTSSTAGDATGGSDEGTGTVDHPRADDAAECRTDALDIDFSGIDFDLDGPGPDGDSHGPVAEGGGFVGGVRGASEGFIGIDAAVQGDSAGTGDVVGGAEGEAGEDRERATAGEAAGDATGTAGDGTGTVDGPRADDTGEGRTAPAQAEPEFDDIDLLEADDTGTGADGRGDAGGELLGMAGARGGEGEGDHGEAGRGAGGAAGSGQGTSAGAEPGGTRGLPRDADLGRVAGTGAQAPAAPKLTPEEGAARIRRMQMDEATGTTGSKLLDELAAAAAAKRKSSSKHLQVGE